MEDKHSKAAPFYVFYNTVESTPNTCDLSINFEDLLCPSLGSLEMSLQITFLLDIDWLLSKYEAAGCGDKPLTILYGDRDLCAEIIDPNKLNLTVRRVLTPFPFGCHHSKMAVLCYIDGSVRVVVSTANLKEDDWNRRTQSLWVSPRCPPLADLSNVNAGESPTSFKSSLLSYFKMYRKFYLNKFIDKIERSDFSAINVFFVGSVPGFHFNNYWALARVRDLLYQHCAIPQVENHRWDLIIQSPSIGQYGPNPDTWLRGVFQSSFCKIAEHESNYFDEQPELKFIYPSENNYSNSNGNFSVSYTQNHHRRQRWLENMVYQWSAVSSDRSAALPHMKSYLRISPDAKKAAFYLLTSANPSQSAWDMRDRVLEKHKLCSYEAGILFIPKFVISKQFFSIDVHDRDRLPVPYDLPPVPYSPNDKLYIYPNLWRL